MMTLAFAQRCASRLRHTSEMASRFARLTRPGPGPGGPGRLQGS